MKEIYNFVLKSSLILALNQKSMFVQKFTWLIPTHFHFIANYEVNYCYWEIQKDKILKFWPWLTSEEEINFFGILMKTSYAKFLTFNVFFFIFVCHFNFDSYAVTNLKPWSCSLLLNLHFKARKTVILSNCFPAIKFLFCHKKKKKIRLKSTAL